jgi:hypothetical protein
MKLKPSISLLVEVGGVLFENYSAYWGTWTSRKLVKTLRITAINEDRLISSDEMAKLLQNERVPFYANVLMSCAHFGKQMKWQMFYLHTSLKFRGISNAGCDLMRKFCMAMARRSYDTLAKICVERALAETRYHKPVK